MCRDVAKVVFSPSLQMHDSARGAALAPYRAGGPDNNHTSIDRATDLSNGPGLRFWIRRCMLMANGSAMVVALRDGRNHVRTFIRDP